MQPHIFIIGISHQVFPGNVEIRDSSSQVEEHLTRKGAQPYWHHLEELTDTAAQ